MSEFVLDDSVRPIKLPEMLPQFEFLMESRVLFAPIKTLGDLSGMGTRKMLDIVGGDFAGPSLRGRILPGGAEWPLIRHDGVGVVNARYTFETDDGVFINIINTGYRHGSEQAIKTLVDQTGIADPESYYLRTSTVFEAPVGRYDWLSRHVFIGIGERHPKVLFLRYYLLR